MDDQPRLTKIQTALLRCAWSASELIGTRGKIPILLFGKIANHYFRAKRILGAIRELTRMQCLELMPQERYLLTVRPMWGAHLPGFEPAPMPDLHLIFLIKEAGCTVTHMIPVPHAPAPERPRRGYRRLVLLANHHLAEQWYGDALPSALSHDVIAIDQPETVHSLALRSQLARKKMIKGLPTPGNRQALRWQVTPCGIESYIEEGVSPTISLVVIQDIAQTLDIAPLTQRL